MVDSVVTLLGKADTTYSRLSSLKPQLENLLVKVGNVVCLQVTNT